MLRTYLKSRLGPLTVTEVSADGGSGASLDSDLLAAARILPGERVRVIPHGGAAPFECHVVPAARGSGRLLFTGAAGAALKPGDRVTLITECLLVDREALEHEVHDVAVEPGNRLAQAGA